ncbi:MAG: multicopper oxidase domain-containing protein [Nitrospirota bacterium]
MLSTGQRLFMVALGVATLLGATAPATAASVVYDLQAKAGYISTPDGGQVYTWSFGDATGFRYPGPLIEVSVGDDVTVNLTNNLPDPDGAGPLKADPVSIVFFGQDVPNQAPVYETVGERATLRSLAPEAAPGGTVSYTFTATKPGTYYYHSGTYLTKHLDMGLIGGIIVRPAAAGQAYDTPDTAYDREHFLLLSAMDPIQHELVERGQPYQATSYLPAYWFVNGRGYPDTLLPDNVPHLVSQPVGSMISMFPGERVLFRMATVDRDLHPFHHHGNHAQVIAQDGRLLQSDPSAGVADLAIGRFTQSVSAGQTVDAIYTWEGKDLGWDVYGHAPADALETAESTLGHGEALPVVVGPPSNDPNADLTFGELYSGSPFLGQTGELGAKHVSLNEGMGEHYMMFHSHHEQEIQNFDEGPGGMMTHIMIMPPTP